MAEPEVEVQPSECEDRRVLGYLYALIRSGHIPLVPGSFLPVMLRNHER